MKSRVTAMATAALVAGCATAAIPDYSLTPPAPGADIYRCVGDDGKPAFIRIKAGLYQTWRGDVWSENYCEQTANTCKVDEAGLIVGERMLILPESKRRIDMIDIFNPAAGTRLSSLAMDGMALEPSRDRCPPHS